MKHIKIDLVPFYKTLKVYFTDKPYELRKEYPETDFRNPQSAEFFRLPDKDKNLHDVIWINQDADWKKANWYDKTAIIMHEVCHCVHFLSEYAGIKDTEFSAYYTQYITAEILKRFDFEKDEIK